MAHLATVRTLPLGRLRVLAAATAGEGAVQVGGHGGAAGGGGASEGGFFVLGALLAAGFVLFELREGFFEAVGC